MTTTHLPHPHPARDLDEEHRRRYLFAVAAIVYADGKVERAEIEVLRVLAEAMGLPESVVDETAAAMREPDRQRVDEILGEITSEEVRLALLGDAILVSYADGRISAGECKEIAEYADYYQNKKQFYSVHGSFPPCGGYGFRPTILFCMLTAWINVGMFSYRTLGCARKLIFVNLIISSFVSSLRNLIVIPFLSASARSVTLLYLFRTLQPAHVGSYPG